ncbi:MAG TPA: hypothetical protein VHL10_09900 [Nitrososphaera sp.]|nr:hypothetical protein [Nitrososphaera sp.]
MHTVSDDAFPFCESVARRHEQIIIAAMIEERESTGWFVKPGVPVPNESASAMKIIQTEIVASIVKQNESYLGKVSYIHVKQELADVILFPLRDTAVFCIVLQRPYDLDEVTSMVSESLKAYSFV